MCGRFAITLPKEAMLDLFDLADAPDLVARYNVAPSQDIAVIALAKESVRKAVPMRWGFHPSWMKEPPGAKSMINARAETAAEKPFFRDSWKKRRCLIPISGFYEWKRDGATKTPHYIHGVDDAPLAVAGLWSLWKQGEAAVLTAGMLTIAANQFMAQIHDRMPVILPREAWPMWLDPQVPSEPLQWMMQPADETLLTMHRVSARVNSPRFDEPSLIDAA
jgi:putative SOS response-associated peptidase YedK